jgi:hypothetical protein
MGHRDFVINQKKGSDGIKKWPGNGSRDGDKQSIEKHTEIEHE